VLPRRWEVERTFARLGRRRRLSKDYEETIESSEAMVKLAMVEWHQDNARRNTAET
jgi:transposase